ncbi:MAG TPA: bifunctional phosphopantothenoylcysteine decarboxylase/phosphopantothenate--cysteine ligase CoaBC, partial [Pusillimonas sp.]|nr:bifunctional phosphopantothenoylcysteine decarboxylase/phosphopantothenate--cysteine ligase CoaBC [Pusillimonas sp.]
MGDLDHKQIVLGLSGGIAGYKSAELLRRLQDEGVTIDVVMTQSATRFITPVTFQALSGRPVFTDAWDNRVPNNMAHINLSRQAHAIVIAPASANLLARLANGMADDLLTTLCLARGQCPLLVAPAMNREMWEHPATQRNIRQLSSDGVVVLGPGTGDQACGETGDGRMLEPHELLAEIIAFFQPKRLSGKRVLITAGPTSERVDPVRVISNRSSGKTGYAIARAAYEAGANVTLVSGPTALACPYGVKRINVESAREMHTHVMGQAQHADIFISVAAVADWHVSNASEQKLKKA